MIGVITAALNAVSHGWSHLQLQKITTRILLRMFPLRRTVPLTHAELAEIAARLPVYRRRFRLFMPIVALLIAAAITGICCVLIAITQRPVLDPVWEHRGGLPMAFPSLFLAFAISIWVGHLFAKWYWGRLFDAYDRYETAITRFDHHRAGRWLTAAFVVAAIPLGILCWDTGEAIGTNGVVFKSGWTTHHYSFDQITQIARYNKYRAPIGLVDMANLQVRFDDGEKVKIRKEKGQTDAAVLDDAAAFLPIERGEMPP